jgi:hypothetical protein
MPTGDRAVAWGGPKRQVLAWLNEQAGRQISQMLRKFELLLDAGEQISITKMARDLSHDNIPADAFLVLIGDAVKMAIEDYGFEIVDDNISNLNLTPLLGRVFISQSQLVHRWEECKRLGYWVEEKDNVSIFFHPDSDYLVSEAVALDRRYHDENQIWNIASRRSSAA